MGHFFPRLFGKHITGSHHTVLPREHGNRLFMSLLLLPLLSLLPLLVLVVSFFSFPRTKLRKNVIQKLLLFGKNMKIYWVCKSKKSSGIVLGIVGGSVVEAWSANLTDTGLNSAGWRALSFFSINVCPAWLRWLGTDRNRGWKRLYYPFFHL